MNNEFSNAKISHSQVPNPKVVAVGFGANRFVVTAALATGLFPKRLVLGVEPVSVVNQYRLLDMSGCIEMERLHSLTIHIYSIEIETIYFFYRFYSTTIIMKN